MTRSPYYHQRICANASICERLMGLLYQADAFESMPSSQHRRLIRKCEWLWTNRQILTHSYLRHDLNPFFKWEVGDYRIIYTYDDEPDDLVIYLVAHRRDVYKRATSLDA